MPNDLYYFHESDLNEGNLATFLDSLPTSELKNKFKVSMRALNDIDRVQSNVLQGYRGPNTDGSSGDSEYLGPNNGLQEVRYWWGISKHINWLPIVGQITWGVGRLSGDTDWHNIFFDSKTGECLSHDEENAASKLNKIGVTLLQSGKFNEAMEYISNAFKHSTDATNRNRYERNKDKAQAEIDALNLNSEGDNLFNQGKYAEAKAKYRAAYDKSNVMKQYEVYKNNRKTAQAEINAINSNSEGDKLFNQGKYAEAKAKYEAAYDKSNVCGQRKIYEINIDKSQAENNAFRLNSEGDKLFNQERYAEAKAKYQAAYNKSNVRKQCEVYKRNRDKAEVEINAINSNSEGDQYFKKGKYAEAKDKYEAACSRSNNRKHCEVYKENMDRAQAEIDAIYLNFEGGNLFKKGKYAEAGAAYQEAYNKSKDSEQCEIYKSNIDKAQAETNALSLNSEGDNLFNQGKYLDAKAKYQEACDKSSVTVDKSMYLRCVNKMDVYIEVIKQFNLIIIEGAFENKLREFAEHLKKLINDEYGPDPLIVNRLHVVSLRIKRKQMNEKLQKLDDENKSELIEAILNIVDTELEILEVLSIKDENLENELKSFEEALGALEFQGSGHVKNTVNLASIATRVQDTAKMLEEKIMLEKLSQTVQLEY